MPRGRKTTVIITLSAEDAAFLQTYLRSTTANASMARRAQILLLLAAGESISEVARRVGMGRQYVYKWAARWQAEGIAGLLDQQGRGR